MTIFFETLKENNSVAKTLVTLLQNTGDYDITEKDIESAMKHIRLSDLLALNDAVEERNMGIVIDILEPFIPGILPQSNETGSPSGVMNPVANTGNKQKQSRATAFTEPTDATGYSSAFSDKGAIAGGRKEMRAVAGKGLQGKQPTGVPIPKDDELGTAMSVTDQFGNIVPIDNKKVAKNITTMLNRMGRG
jgi:hypothetical protein